MEALYNGDMKPYCMEIATLSALSLSLESVWLEL